MSLCALLASATLACGTVPPLGPQYLGPHARTNRPLATPALYPANLADDAHRPGFNGAVFRTRPIVGPGHGPYARVYGEPGPEYYGAWGEENQRVYVRVGHLVVSVSPWTRIPEEGLERLERARNDWLRERGYVGGVRTFVNDRFATAEVAAADGPPTPRATIEIPAEWRPKKRFQVQAGDRVSLPPTAPRDLAARVLPAVTARAD